MTHAFIGLMVLYRLTADEARATNMRREHASQIREKMRKERPGFQAHVGNSVGEGDRIPMIVTFFHQRFIDGQAFFNGNDSLWVTSVEEGDQPGQWEAITDG